MMRNEPLVRQKHIKKKKRYSNIHIDIYIGIHLYIYISIYAAVSIYMYIRKTEQTKMASSVCLLQTENRNGKFSFVSANEKRKFV